MKYSNRHKESVKIVKLPSVYTPEDRGVDSCCCKFLVFGDVNYDDHKANITGAWIRDVDEWRFYLVRENGYEIDQQSFTFPNEPSARYCQVDWTDILIGYGPGCYELRIDYSISGISGTIVWGKYDAQWFSLHRARKLVQFRTVLNSLQTIENINFTGSNVIDCINFEGYFGDRNPNTQIDNIIYSSREVRKVHRENLNEYYLFSKPLNDCIVRKLLDLHLLSENNIYISDFNPNNPHQYLAQSCIVESVEKPNYMGQFAKINATFGDKIKNSRSRYGI